VDRAPRLLDVLRERLRLRRASERTAEAYEGWVRRFVRFHGRRHPRTMGEREVTAFLSHLATARRVSASTQNQALSALLFLYRDVLGSPFGWLDGLVRAKRGHRRPTVLSREEAQRVLAEMEGVPRLIALLLYGSGLRISEACALRVKDVDFDRREILVRQGKGGRDRLTVLPALLDEALRAQIERVRAWHLREVAVGRGHVFISEDPGGPVLTLQADAGGDGRFEHMMGDTLDVPEGSRVTVRVQYRGLAGKKVRLLRGREVVEEVVADTEELTRELALAVDGPGYLRAEVRGTRGRPERGEVVHAMTNPLYIRPRQA